MIIQRQPAKGLIPSRCLSPVFILFFLSHTHRDTHTYTHGPGLPVQHYLSIPTATSHTPAQCSPKHLITFIKGLHTEEPVLSGEEKPALTAGPCLPSGAMGRTLWAMGSHQSRHLHSCCTYAFTTVITCFQKMGCVGPGFKGFDQKSRDMHTQALSTLLW